MRSRTLPGGAWLAQGALLAAAALLSAPLSAAALLSAPEQSEAPSRRVELRRDILVAAGETDPGGYVLLGGSLRNDGVVVGDVIALAGTVELNGEVRGDLLVAGGVVKLGPRARIGGDLLSLSGVLESAPGVSVGGERVHLASTAELYRRHLGGVGDPAEQSHALFFVGLRCLLLAAWLGLAVLVVLTRQPAVGLAVHEMARRPLRCLALGLAGFATFAILASLALMAAGTGVGIPALALVVLVAAAIKVAGMVGVFELVGAGVRRAAPRLVGPGALALAAAGAVTLGLVRLIPGLGSLVWMAASLLGVGAWLGRPRRRMARYVRQVPLPVEPEKVTAVS